MTTKTWQNPAGGDWSVPGNWNGGVPTAPDDANITDPLAVPFSVNVTDSESANTVTLPAAGATLFIEAGGSLAANTLILDGGTLEIGGVLQGGTLQSKSGPFFAVGGTLSGEQIDGPLALSGTNQTLTVTGGLLLRDTIGQFGGELDIEGNSDLVNFVSDTTLDGSGVQFDTGSQIFLGGVSTTDQIIITAGKTLTIGTLGAIRENGSGDQDVIDGQGTIVNNGTISANGSNNNLFIDPTSFTNTGSISFTNGASGSLTASGPFVNTGSISISGGGTLSLFVGNTLTNSGVFNVSGTSTLQMEDNVTGAGTILLSQSSTAQFSGLETGVFTFLDATGLLAIGNGLAFDGTIVGFQSVSTTIQDTIELINQPVTKIDPYIGDASGGTLTLEDNGDLVAHLNFSGNYVGANFATTAVGNNTFLTLVPCFSAGTRILTERGAVPVEALHQGQRVWAHSGDEQMALWPIVWIGHRDVDCWSHPEPRQVWPVRVTTGVFGPDQPCRDLFLSPDHAVFVSGMLIPVRALINGTTIKQVPVRTVTYYHVELDEHAILLAEGMPAESYLDVGDRSAFANGGGPIALFPNFSIFRWETAGCAPLVAAGPKLEAVRRAVAGARAA